MHRLQIRDDRRGQDRRQPLQEALDDGNRGRVVGGHDLRRRTVGGVAPVVEARHVHAWRTRQRTQQIEPRRALRAPLVQQLVDLQNHILCLAEHKGVDEWRKRLRYKRSRAAGEDDRIIILAVEAADRDA